MNVRLLNVGNYMLKTQHPAFNMNHHSSQNELQSKMV